MGDNDRDLVLALAERLYICSRLLTAAAERLGWDSAVVRGLIEELRTTTRSEVTRHAGTEER